MPTLPFKHPRGATYALYDEILLEDRGRQDYGDLAALAESIKIFGIIQLPLAIPLDPPVDGKRFRLVSGGRRTSAMLTLKPSHIPLNLRTDVKDLGTLIEMELEENIQRKDMTWQEETLLIRKAHIHHAASTSRTSKWGAVQTGKLFGKTHAHVAHALHVANAILSGDKEIAACSSIKAAYTVLLARKEQELDAAIASKRVIHKRPQPQSSVQGTSVGSSISPTPPGLGLRVLPDTDVDALIDGDIEALSKGSGIELQKGNATFFNGMKDFPISQWMQKGDSVKELMPSWPDECVDHIITDPPYGIDIDDETLVNAKEIQATHGREDNLAMFPEMLRQFYRILKPRGYCIFWIDIEHIDLLKKLARDVGFTVQNQPFHWVKTHKCKNLSPTTNFTNQIEHALVCRKGTAALELMGPANYVMADGSIDRKMYSNPFAKPYAVWAHLITAVSKQGQRIADPFAGQGSCPRALLNLGREPLAGEVDEVHYNKSISVVTDMIKEIAGEGVTFH